MLDPALSPSTTAVWARRAARQSPYSAHVQPGRLATQLPVETVLGRRSDREHHPVDDPALDGPCRVVQKLDTTGFERHDNKLCRLGYASCRRGC